MITLILMVLWLMLLLWFGDSAQNGETQRASLLLVGAWITSVLFIVINRRKVPEDRSVVLERTRDLGLNFLGNLVAAFMAYVVMGMV
jgi:hypothetical protein